METAEPTKKSTLATIAVVVSIIGGIVAIATGVWALLPDRGKRVEAYQRQVLATCQQVRAVVSEEHNEVVRLNPNASGPDDAFLIDKTALLSVMRSSQSRVRGHFELMESQPPPDELRETYATAQEAQEAWLENYTRIAWRIDREIRDSDPIGRVNQLGFSLTEGSGEVDVRLNSAMTRLAGQDCRCTR